MKCEAETCDSELDPKNNCIDCDKWHCPECIRDCGWVDVDGAICNGNMLCDLCRDRSEHGICKRCGEDKEALTT